jgi:catalase
VVLLVEECFRQAKVIGAWGAGTAVLDAAGVDGLGIVRGDTGADVLARVQEDMALHRVWDRFAVTV